MTLENGLRGTYEWLLRRDGHGSTGGERRSGD